MEYNVKINIADSFDILSEAEEGMPLVSNVRLKDATSLSENITLGTAVSKQLTFTLYNSPVEIYDGQKVTLYIDPVEEEAEIDLTEYELTDEEVLNDLFEVQEDPDGGNEFTVAQASALATEMGAIGTEHDYDLYPNEEEGELDDDDENPSNDVYRDDGVGELEDEPGEEEDFVMMGEFYITKIISKDDIYEITALDGFILMNEKYVPTNNVDTVENMYADFIAQMDTTLGLEVYSEPEYPELTIIWDYDTTYREAAGYFAGLMGGYATFDRNGAMDIRQYMQNEVPINEIISMDINSDGAVTISGMRCDTDITALENWIQTEEDIPGFSIDFVNPFMTQSILNNIYTTYYEYLEYVPAKLTVDWYDRIQAGDLIKVEDNWILITNQTINFASGTSVIDSLGTTATLSEGQITDPMVRKMQRTQSNLKTSVQIAQELAQEADLMATATNQHFWNETEGIYYLSEDTTVDTSKEYFSKSGDTYTRVTPTGNENPAALGWYERLGAGAYVTEIPQEEFNDPESTNYHSGKNSLWNSLGMVFRNGLRNLLTILTGDTTGVAIYDGQGNSDENIVASFTDHGVVIGSSIDGQILLEKDNITMTNSMGGMAFRVLQGADEEATTSTKEYMSISTQEVSFIRMPTVGEHTKVLSNQYAGSLNVKISLEVWKVNNVTYTVTQTVPNLGNFTININNDGVSGTVAGSISFDDTTSTVTINITTSTYTGDVWFISNSVELTYLTYLKTPTIALGEHADVYDLSDKAIVVGNPTQNGNAFVVHRNGRITTGGHNSPVGTVVDAYVGSGGVEVESGYWLHILEITLDPGVWLLNACVRFPSSTSGIRRANLSLTSNDNTLQWVSAPMGSNQVTQGTFSKIFQPTTRTSYFLNVYQNSGGRMTMPEGSAQSVNAIRAIRIV